MVKNIDPENQAGRLEEKINRIKRISRILVSLNQLSDGKADPFLYADKACEMLVDSEIYGRVWIVFFDEKRDIDKISSSGSVGGAGRKAAYDSLVKAECSRSVQAGEGVKSLKPPAATCKDCPVVITSSLKYEDRVFGLLAAAIPGHWDGDGDETQLFTDIAEALSLAFSCIYRERTEQWFKYALKNMPNTFCVLSTDFRYLVVNERYAGFLNASQEEIQGRKVSDFFNENEYKKRILPLLQRCLAGEDVEDAMIGRDVNGAPVRLRTFYYPYIGDEGKVQGILSHGIEISERKSSEKALFTLFRRLSDEAQYGIAIADLTGRLVYINKYFAGVCGYEPRELLGKHIGMLYPERYAEEVGLLMQELAEKGSFKSKEMYYKKRNGPEAPLLLSGMMLYDDFNKPIRMLVMAQDLSPLKDAEDQLKWSEARLRKLIDTATDTILILTEKGVIIEINNSACEFLGYEMSDIVGKTIGAIDADYTVEKFEAFWEKVPVEEQKIFESRHKRKNGDIFPVEVSARKIFIDGKMLIMSIARDITEHNNVKKQMLQAVKKAEESDRMKSAFLANMSHEIRTPLNGILGFSALMNDPGNTPEKQQKYYEIIQQSGQRLLSTINDLIDISRIETGATEIDITPVEINVLFDELYTFFSPDIKGKHLEFNIHKGTDENLYVKTDYEKLYAILSNLIRNAIKFTNSGSITMAYRLSSSEIIFEISDTGVGIEQDKLSSIFNRFVQADQSLTKPYEGFGLGLSICREYTEMLNGRISVESEPGSGTTFTVSLPKSV